MDNVRQICTHGSSSFLTELYRISQLPMEQWDEEFDKLERNPPAGFVESLRRAGKLFDRLKNR